MSTVVHGMRHSGGGEMVKREDVWCKATCEGLIALVSYVVEVLLV